MQMIDINKKYRTRDGRKVVLYTVNGVDEDRPVVGEIFYDFGWSYYSWHKDGRCRATNEAPSDLVEDTNEIECETFTNAVISVSKKSSNIAVSIIIRNLPCPETRSVSLSPTKTRQLIQILEEAIDE